MTDHVDVREVGLRDGLQLVQTILPAATKIEWARLQAKAGFTEIEVTSFVPPSVIPQFADAAEVLAGARKIEGLCASVLVPNLKGGIRAFDHAAEKVSMVLSASEQHNMSNVRRTTDASIAEFGELVRERDARGLKGKVAISCAISTSFGCSIQGDVPEARVFEICEQLVAAGTDELNVADTVGYGNPVQVRRIFTEVGKIAGDVPVAAHFHDTRAMGLANVVAAVEAGVRRFDASLGGLGGCPFAPGATGNIATEDCVYLLENIGLKTGIDIPAMLHVREQLNGWLPSEPVEGRLMKAKPAKTFRPAA